MKPIVLLVVFLSQVSWGILPLGQPKAQAPVEILEQDVEFLFNDWLQFTVHFESSQGLQEGFVFYQFSGSDRAWVYEGEFSQDQILQVRVELNEDNQPAPFTYLEYWFRFASDFGDIYESERYTLYYDDNRYPWQILQNSPFTIYWHQGDMAFAQAILAAAHQGITRSQQLLPLPDLAPVVLRVYANAEDVQLIAQQAGFSWQAGHTHPQAGLILLSLPPGPQQSLEIQRQVPHEIAHLMLYESLGAAYFRLPAWLNEGVASNVEIYSDPNRTELLQLANAGGTLIPFFSLCKAFPQDSASARLAYAQSASFVRYLFEKYKSVGFSLLVDAYAQGDDCNNAPLADFGKDLIKLEAEWREQTFASVGGAFAWFSAVPWQPILLSAGIALALYGLLRITKTRR
ncbi:MAG: peptidase MA family metallohydrolase [Anaerolineales bacterium]